eukprot:c27796_g1_i2 orf=538-1764(-)
MKGDGKISGWSCHGNLPSLPPRSPTFPSMGCPSLDMRTGPYTGQKKSTSNVIQRQHQRTPSAGFLMEEQLSWLDDLLDDSDSTNKKGFHRRSASDSFAYLESPSSLYKISDIAEEEEFDCSGSNAQQSKFDTDKCHSEGQLMSLFTEIEKLQRQHNLPVSVSRKHNLENRGRMKGTLTVTPEKLLVSGCNGVSRSASDCIPVLLDCELEGESLEEKDLGGTWRDSIDIGSPCNPNTDSSKAKRQSAQRSRVRKLQYIAELERIVNSLQTEVSMLSHRVAYLEHGRMLLNVDNSFLQQRTTICVQNKKAKDVQIETLMAEVLQWRNCYQFQLQQQKKLMQKGGQPTEEDIIQDNKSVLLECDVLLEEFNKLNLGTAQQTDIWSANSNAVCGLMRNLNAVSLSTGTSVKT